MQMNLLTRGPERWRKKRVAFRALLLLSIVLRFVIPGNAQEFRLFQHTVQVHGFASQGYVYTNHNNWLTMNTSGSGSAEMTDMGLNVSTALTDKLRVGAQVYDRELGRLGQWHPSLDWAFADYRFASWFGVRGGKVKTTLGLYNDTQDLDFLRTFALLPQSIYPTDLRDTTIAHSGGDVYGKFDLPRHAGALSYTVYAGHRSDSMYSGYPYVLTQYGSFFHHYGGLQYGADLRWETPLKGLLLGVSRMDQDIRGDGENSGFPPLQTSKQPKGLLLQAPRMDEGNLAQGQAGWRPVWEKSKQDWTNQFYGQYTRGPLQISSEYRRYFRDQIILSGMAEDLDDIRGWYVAGSYRVCKRLEVGSYYSHYTVSNTFMNPPKDPDLPANHEYDKVITGRVDLNRFWNIKIEGHFIDGFGNAPYPAGFYPQQNPGGFRRNTNGLVIKTGFNF